MNDEKTMCPANFRKLVKRVDALEKITLTKLFKNIEPSDDSFKIQYGNVLVAFNPNNEEELKFVKRFFDQFMGEEKDMQ